MKDPLFVLTASWSLAALFLAAGAHKLIQLDRFRASLAAYELLPASLNALLARIVPIIELAVGSGLLIRPGSTVTAAAAGFLLVLYSLSIGSRLLRGGALIECGCTFGAEAIPLSPWLLIRNGFLLGLSFIALLPQSGRQLTWLDHFTAVTAVLTFAIFYLVSEQLLLHHSMGRTGFQRHDQ